MAEHLRVIILEDSEDDTLLTVKELQRGGYDPVWKRVDSKKDLSESLENHEWDVFLADFRLPRFGGLEALKTMKKMNIDLPFIILSGTIGEETAVEAMRIGASDFIMKDKMARLVPAIRREVRDARERKAREDVEEAYRILVEQSLQGIIIIQDSRIVFSNKAFANIVGYSIDELLAMNPNEVVSLSHSDDRMGMTEYHQSRLKGETVPNQYEIRLIRKEQTLAFVNVMASRIEYRGRPAIQAFYLDITERKEAEENLEYRTQFEELIAVISAQFINLPLEKTDDSIQAALRKIGEFMDIDRSYVFLFRENETKMDNTHEWCREGINSCINKLQDLNVKDFYHAHKIIKQAKIINVPKVEDLPPEAERDKKEFQSEGIQSLVCVPLICGKSVLGFFGLDSVREEKIWTEDILSLLQIISQIFINALERRKAEEARRLSEEKYMYIFENAGDGIIYADSKGIVREINQAFLKITGIPRESIIGKHTIQLAKKFVRPKILPQIMSNFKQLMLKKKARPVEIEFQNKILEVSSTSDKNTAGITAVIRDITFRKRSEERLQKELREKEVLLKEVHHRVKNNLQVISSLLSLQSHHIQNEKDRELFRESQDRVRSMALVHEKLYQSKNLTLVDFKDYIGSLVNGLLRMYHLNPGKTHIDVKVTGVQLSIDLSVPCGLIINELVSNAMKHAFPDSFEGKQSIQISLSRLKNKKIELMVHDNGIGIPEGFDFRNTESLGLRLVTILVEDQLGGDIQLVRDQGSKFRIVFTESV